MMSFAAIARIQYRQKPINAVLILRPTALAPSIVKRFHYSPQSLAKGTTKTVKTSKKKDDAMQSEAMLDRAQSDSSFNATPALAQYLKIKRDPQYHNCIVFFQLGGFYEAFFEDAPVIASVCGIMLTTKGASNTFNGEPIPMAGIPAERSEGHIAKLLKQGYRVVLVEQSDSSSSSLWTPKFPNAKSMKSSTSGQVLGRNVTRVLTPGTAPEYTASSPRAHHYLVSLAFGSPFIPNEGVLSSTTNNDIVIPVAMSYADVSIGEVRTVLLDSTSLMSELSALGPVEIIVPSDLPHLNTLASTSHATRRGLSNGSLSMDKLHQLSLNPKYKRHLQYLHPFLEDFKSHGSPHDLLRFDMPNKERDVSKHVQQTYLSIIDDSVAPHVKNTVNSVKPCGRIYLPGDLDGTYLSYTPSIDFTARCGISSIMQIERDHRFPSSSQNAHVNQLDLFDNMNDFSDLELCTLGGLFGYLRWTSNGKIPRFSVPISMSQLSSATSLTNSGITSTYTDTLFDNPPSENKEESSINGRLFGMRNEGSVNQADARVDEGREGEISSRTSLSTRLQELGRPAARLYMNETTQRSLELTRPLHGRRRGRGSLLDLLDKCKTHMGSRLLDSRIVNPLASLDPILHRLDAVEVLAGDVPTEKAYHGGGLASQSKSMNLAVQAALSPIPDIERCFTRLSASYGGRVSARDLLIIRDGLAAAQRLGLLLASWNPALYDVRGLRRSGTTDSNDLGSQVMKELDLYQSEAMKNPDANYSQVLGMNDSQIGIDETDVISSHVWLPESAANDLITSTLDLAKNLYNCASDEVDAFLLQASRFEFDVNWPPGNLIPLFGVGLDHKNIQTDTARMPNMQENSAAEFFPQFESGLALGGSRNASYELALERRNSLAASAVLLQCSAILSRSIDLSYIGDINLREEYCSEMYIPESQMGPINLGLSSNATQCFHDLSIAFFELHKALKKPTASDDFEVGKDLGKDEDYRTPKLPIGGTFGNSYIRIGYDENLDLARSMSISAKDTASELEALLRQVTGIPAPWLRLRRLEKDGWVVEVDMKPKGSKSLLDAWLKEQEDREETERISTSPGAGKSTRADARHSGKAKPVPPQSSILSLRKICPELYASPNLRFVLSSDVVAKDENSATKKTTSTLKPGVVDDIEFPESILFLRPTRSTEKLRRFRCEACSRLDIFDSESSMRLEAEELRVLNELTTRILSAEKPIRGIAKAIAVVDVASTFAQLARENMLTRPILTEENVPIRKRGLLLPESDSSLDASGQLILKNIMGGKHAEKEKSKKNKSTKDSNREDTSVDVGSSEMYVLDARHLIVEHALWRSDVSSGWKGESLTSSNYNLDDATLSNVIEKEGDSADHLIEKHGLCDEIVPSAQDSYDASPSHFDDGFTQHPRHITFVPNDIILGGHSQWKDWQPQFPSQFNIQKRFPRINLSDLGKYLLPARCALILGTNMGGKSTYLRSAAHLVILAQLGSFVPATFARLGIVDAVYTRIGASDDLQEHRSTFRVEMEETSMILHRATKKSLVIVDELGRGTAVQDGLSISLAVLEELTHRIKARTLFASHFPELAVAAISQNQIQSERHDVLGLLPPSVKCLRMDWHSSDDGKIYLTHQVKVHPIHAFAYLQQLEQIEEKVGKKKKQSKKGKDGKINVELNDNKDQENDSVHYPWENSTELNALLESLSYSQSHGIHVAKHSNMPNNVVLRATDILNRLDESKVGHFWAAAVLSAVGKPTSV